MKIQSTDVVSFRAPKSGLLSVLKEARRLSGSRWHSENVKITVKPQEIGWNTGNGGIRITFEWGFVIGWSAYINVAGSVKDDGDYFNVNLSDIYKAISNCKTRGECDTVAFVYTDRAVAVRDASVEETAVVA